MSGVGENVFGESGVFDERPEPATQRGAFVRTAEPVARTLGSGVVAQKRKLYAGFDLNAARVGDVTFSVGKESIMSDVEAAQITEEFLDANGLARESHAVRVGALDSLLVYQAMNSSSVLSNEDAEFVLSEGGAQLSMTFQLIRDRTGPNLRRFFRAHADRQIEVLQDILSKDSPMYPEQQVMAKRIKNIAAQKGLQMYPHLISDVAEMAMCLNLSEISALQKSKAQVLDSSDNVRDQVEVLRAKSNAGRQDGKDA